MKPLLKEGRRTLYFLADFLKRVDLRRVNIQVTESLIKAGAFSAFKENRAQMLVKFDEIYKNASSFRQQHASGQTSFFDLVEDQESFCRNSKISGNWRNTC